jgi:hypothetical protein
MERIEKIKETGNVYNILVKKLPGYRLIPTERPYEFMWERPQRKKLKVGFEVLTAVGTKMAVFWVVAPCSMVEVYQRFRGPCCLHHQGDESSP